MGTSQMLNRRTEAVKPLAASLRSVDPAARDAMNAWLATRGAKRLHIHDREFELHWTDSALLPMQFGVELTFGAHRVFAALESFAALDPLLVGHPFAGMPEPYRNLVVQRVIARVLATLPPALAEAADVHAVHWNRDAFPLWDCALGFTLIRLPEGVESQGVLAVNAPATLEWLNAKLPASVPAVNDRGDLPLSLTMLLGTTRLGPVELRDLAAGDVVSIESGDHSDDGMAVSLITPDRRRAWSCRLRRKGLRVGSAQNDMASIAELRGTSGRARALTDNISGADTMNDESPALDIPVTFDLGEVAVALRDLERIQPGYLFELPQDAANATVNLRVSGTVVAEGRLVAIGKRLGVRIALVRTRSAPGA